MKERWPFPGKRRQTLLDFPCLPDQIGSKEHMMIILAWRRLEPACTWVDIMMRMMKSPSKQINHNTLNMRQNRCLEAFFVPFTWQRTGEWNDKHLGSNKRYPLLTDAARADNSTRGFTPGLIFPHLGEVNGNRVPIPKWWLDKQEKARRLTVPHAIAAGVEDHEEEDDDDDDDYDDDADSEGDEAPSHPGMKSQKQLQSELRRRRQAKVRENPARDTSRDCINPALLLSSNNRRNTWVTADNKRRGTASLSMVRKPAKVPSRTSSTGPGSPRKRRNSSSRHVVADARRQGADNADADDDDDELGYGTDELIPLDLDRSYSPMQQPFKSTLSRPIKTYMGEASDYGRGRGGRPMVDPWQPPTGQFIPGRQPVPSNGPEINLLGLSHHTNSRLEENPSNQVGWTGLSPYTSESHRTLFPPQANTRYAFYPDQGNRAFEAPWGIDAVERSRRVNHPPPTWHAPVSARQFERPTAALPFFPNYNSHPIRQVLSDEQSSAARCNNMAFIGPTSPQDRQGLMDFAPLQHVVNEAQHPHSSTANPEPKRQGRPYRHALPLPPLPHIRHHDDNDDPLARYQDEGPGAYYQRTGNTPQEWQNVVGQAPIVWSTLSLKDIAAASQQPVGSVQLHGAAAAAHGPAVSLGGSARPPDLAGDMIEDSNLLPDGFDYGDYRR